jgi:hypothetical protein
MAPLPAKADAPQVRQVPLWTAYAALALGPQMVFWVAFTVAAGLVTGALTAAAPGRRRT